MQAIEGITKQRELARWQLLYPTADYIRITAEMEASLTSDSGNIPVWNSVILVWRSVIPVMGWGYRDVARLINSSS